MAKLCTGGIIKSVANCIGVVELPSAMRNREKAERAPDEVGEVCLGKVAVGAREDVVKFLHFLCGEVKEDQSNQLA
eukprot:10824880-Ditylum_brightwellii.AAC.1